MLADLKNQGLTLFETGEALTNHLLKHRKKTVKLLRPRNGKFTLAKIFEQYAIVNRDEEVNFLRKLSHL